MRARTVIRNVAVRLNKALQRTPTPPVRSQRRNLRARLRDLGRKHGPEAVADAAGDVLGERAPWLVNPNWPEDPPAATTADAPALVDQRKAWRERRAEDASLGADALVRAFGTVTHAVGEVTTILDNVVSLDEALERIGDVLPFVDAAAELVGSLEDGKITPREALEGLGVLFTTAAEQLPK